MAKLTGAEAYRLKHECGLTYAQIAERYNTTWNAARNKCRRYVPGAEQPAEAQPPLSVDDNEQITDQTVCNTREVESRSYRISTLAQLIEHCKIDLNEWVIERHTIKKHDVGRKHTIKEMTWDEGKMTGSLSDDGKLFIEPMWIVGVSLIKRHPEAIQPVIAPVNINVKFGKPAQRGKGYRAALILPDPQFGFSREIFHGKLTPFHDRLALDVVRQIAQVIEPELSVWLGDLVDFSGWSDKFIKQPEFYWTTQPALIETSWNMARIRALTRCEAYAIPGNHDMRPETQIKTHLVEAYGLKSADQLDAPPVMSVDNLLGLSRMGVTYVESYPNGEVWINETTKCIHGEKVRGQPGQTAAAVVRDANESILFGHVHRREMATKTIPGRDGYRTVTAYSPGCLCHVDGRVPGSSKSNQWQQGAAVVWFDERDSTIVPIDIFHGRAVYQGHLYQGCDYVEDLRHQTGWQF